MNAAEQGARVFESLLLKQERRTGARVFSHSATVGDNELVFRQTFEVAGLDLVKRETGRAFDVRRLVGVVASDVNNDSLALRDQLLGFFNADAWDFVVGILIVRRGRRG